MKKQILLIIFGLSSFFVNAQGNLQFNQVLTYSGSLAANTSTANYTVPSGKVWKVEFAEGGYDFYLQINNIGSVGIENQINSPRVNISFWLKANDLIKCIAYGYIGSYFISIIEYNIIP
jgi:hypothetical protein